MNMVSVLFFVGLTIFAFYVFSTYRGLARNLAAAKHSGIPYIIVPVFTFNRFWLITHRLWLPFIRRLPNSWTSPWLPYVVGIPKLVLTDLCRSFLDPEWSWLYRHELFAKHGSDTLLLVAPGQNTMFVADPDVITQITNRRNDFPKPTQMYKAVDIFGKNVVSTEGSVWRQHRKITSVPFTEANNRLVWEESLRQSQSMLHSWIGRSGNESRTINSISVDTMRFSLHLISRAGFGVRLLWPNETSTGDTNQPHGMINSAQVPAGHTMSFKDALSTLLENLISVMLLPRWLLAWSPFQAQKVAYESFLEWKQYMNELYETKKKEVRGGNASGSLDLMGALVKGAGIAPDSPNIVNGDMEKSLPNEKEILSDEEILGNVFVFMLAGHETTANTLHFGFLFLALNQHSQGHLQRDLESIFGDRPIEEWDYDHDLPKLFGGMAGAVMNEELRLMPPVTNIPKSTLEHSPQPMTIGERRVVVPENTLIYLATVAVHRNPNAHWPAGPQLQAKSKHRINDLDDFCPERWLPDRATARKGPSTPERKLDQEDFGGPEGNVISAALYSPPKGAYVPFSDGARACLGRRFAQVEILAVFAVIFRNYSIELAVDDFATDEEVERMPKGGAERKKVWQKAAERCNHLMHYGMMTIITNQMRQGKVPVRFVKKGEERFVFE